MKNDPRSCERNLEARKKNQDLFQDLFQISTCICHIFLKLFHSQNRRVHYFNAYVAYLQNLTATV